VAKPEWGTKRTCGSCGARFYDMRRQPIVCPKCGALYEDEAPPRPRRAKPAPPEKKPKPAPVAEEAPDLEEAADLEGADLDETRLDGDDDDKTEDMIEDASDLGEDDEDMAEVIDHLDSDSDDD